MDFVIYYFLKWKVLYGDYKWGKLYFGVKLYVLSYKVCEYKGCINGKIDIILL